MRIKKEDYKKTSNNSYLYCNYNFTEKKFILLLKTLE